MEFEKEKVVIIYYPPNDDHLFGEIYSLKDAKLLFKIINNNNNNNEDKIFFIQFQFPLRNFFLNILIKNNNNNNNNNKIKIK